MYSSPPACKLHGAQQQQGDRNVQELLCISSVPHSLSTTCAHQDALGAQLGIVQDVSGAITTSHEDLSAIRATIEHGGHSNCNKHVSLTSFSFGCHNSRIALWSDTGISATLVKSRRLNMTMLPLPVLPLLATHVTTRSSRGLNSASVVAFTLGRSENTWECKNDAK